MEMKTVPKPVVRGQSNSKHAEVAAAVMATASNGHAIQLDGLTTSEKRKLVNALVMRCRRNNLRVRTDGANSENKPLTIWAEAK